MPLTGRIEAGIDHALARAARGAPPPLLSAALFHAVKPGGARIRPTISLSVALACGDEMPARADAAATAIELIHCASLVHDDLPCFDDAEERRGKASVHVAYGEALAVLTGDSLIVQAFETLAGAPDCGPLVLELARYTGMPHGICAGQGWESEAEIDLSTYHRTKTGALFTAATRMGAVAAGHDPEPWTELGARIGEAFQVADDLLDVQGNGIGKPMGQDVRLDRPSAVSELGIAGAIRRLENILSGAIASIPACPGEAMLAAMVRKTAERLTPAHHATPAE